MLHLGCHAVAGRSLDDSQLILADKQPLPIRRILDQARARPADAPGGRVVLAACTSDLTVTDHDEALTLASAFLAVGVVGSRWKIPGMPTALLMFMLHWHLARQPDDSMADALRAAQLWMLDPHRHAPREMPETLAAEANRLDLAELTAWAAFSHHGR
jgi:CHAT domain-containing protein